MTATTPTSKPRRHAARVAFGFARMSAQEELQYRANFWVYLIDSVFAVSVSLVGLWLVFRQVDELNGWQRYDLLVVVGVFFALSGFVNGILHPSITKLVADVRTGDLDLRLLKPVDAQFVSVVQQAAPWRMLDAVLGMGIVSVGIALGPSEVTLASVLLTLVALALACLITAGFWSLLACLAFWTIQGEGIVWALDDMYEHLRWPISIFPPGLRMALTVIFPAGFAIMVPAHALTGRLDLLTLLMALALAVALLVLARAAWLAGLRRYEGASG